ncbi:MAG TPA: DUF2249 domain-containing protein [Candidatus Acidoferrum sp.]|nr:DUF2249 domain-containing protein [Candidatus Acidoferrum sp.]
MSRKLVTLDVREDLRCGREPFGKIMQTVAALKDNEDLLLIAPFQPTPLLGVLAKQGFSHEAKQTPSGDCEVKFTRSHTPSEVPSLPTEPPCRPRPVSGGASALDVDARGLEPPQPLVKILEAVAELPAGARLRAHTDRRPMHLYAQLEERGFAGESEEQPDGSFVTYVRHV